MELEFELTSNDIQAFYRRASASAWWLVAFEWSLVFVGVIAIDWLFFRRQPAIALAISVVGIGIYAVRQWRARQAVHERHVQALARNQGHVTGRHRVSVWSDGFEQQLGEVRTGSLWKEVKRVVETDEHFFLIHHLGGATMLPKRVFRNAGQLSWFRSAANGEQQTRVERIG
jgi:hypothetical protein